MDNSFQNQCTSFLTFFSVRRANGRYFTGVTCNKCRSCENKLCPSLVFTSSERYGSLSGWNSNFSVYKSSPENCPIFPWESNLFPGLIHYLLHAFKILLYWEYCGSGDVYARRTDPYQLGVSSLHDK